MTKYYVYVHEITEYKYEVNAESAEQAEQLMDQIEAAPLSSTFVGSKIDWIENAETEKGVEPVGPSSI